MGQITVPVIPDIILTDVDRLVARNADGGLSPASQHVILLGEDAGQNLTQSEVIAIGAFALDGGMTDILLEGSIAIGVNAASALVADSIGSPVGLRAVTVIGQDAAQSIPLMDSCVIIGAGALKTLASGSSTISKSVYIGNEVLGTANGTGDYQSNVVIGYRALRRDGGASPTTSSASGNVIAGAQACSNVTRVLSDCVILGDSACQNVSSTGNFTSSIVLGSSACASGATAGDKNVLIGDNCNVNATNSPASCQNNVLLGANGICRGSQNIVIGAQSSNGSSGSGVGNILIGFGGGGAGFTASDNHKFLVETIGATGSGSTRRGVMFGDLATGCLLIGISVQGTDRDLPGTNALKIINGTATGNPIGGGMFYATAGELTWRSSTGIDYALTPMSVRGVFTVAGLGALGNLAAGQKAYVTDALAPAFAAVVAGGGAVYTPVYYDGAAWRCG